MLSKSAVNFRADGHDQADEAQVEADVGGRNHGSLKRMELNGGPVEHCRCQEDPNEDPDYDSKKKHHIGYPRG
jgi:hypothetical protein